jgi:hypothetical protein
MGEVNRQVPLNDLDLQYLLTQPAWGKDDIPQELKDHLTQIIGEVKDEHDQTQQIYAELWGLLGMYTKDIRLGNLSRVWGEVAYVQFYLDLAADCLTERYLRAFIKSISLAVTVLEVTQSAGGFLRKRQGTVTYEQHKREEEPAKQGLFGRKNKGGYE